MPSWSWTYPRKDMHVYGTEGAIMVDNQTDMRYTTRKARGKFTEKQATPLAPGLTDSFSYLNEVVQGRVKVSPADLSSLENNLIVVEILDAARKSAKTGQTVKLK